MLSFESDYTEGAHPAILEKFIETNMDQQSGYGVDVYSESARKKIAKACGKEDADIYFITGGTQTNQLVIDTMLKPYEGVVAAVTGHVAAHEAGAIEYTGHKVLTVPQYLGKLKASDVKELVDTFYNDANHEHMVFPGMVYISHPTEYGTLYTKEELKEWAVYDEQSNMFIWERLGYGNYSPTHFGLSLPEVTEVRHNEDGTIVLTIHAVCDSVVCNDAVITHELTMKIQDDGTIQYVGNRILDNGIDNIPRYQYRLGNLQN